MSRASRQKQKKADETAKLAALKLKVEQSLDNHPKMKAFRPRCAPISPARACASRSWMTRAVRCSTPVSAFVKDYMRDILRDIGAVLNDVDYRITLSGHTDAAQYQNGDAATATGSCRPTGPTLSP